MEEATERFTRLIQENERSGKARMEEWQGKPKDDAK